MVRKLIVLFVLSVPFTPGLGGALFGQEADPAMQAHQAAKERMEQFQQESRTRHDEIRAQFEAERNAALNSGDQDESSSMSPSSRRGMRKLIRYGVLLAIAAGAGIWKLIAAKKA
ncbi:MAG: hypothetical protein R3C28_19995 [Pirellulaceae bacterium]